MKTYDIISTISEEDTNKKKEFQLKEDTLIFEKGLFRIELKPMLKSNDLLLDKNQNLEEENLSFEVTSDKANITTNSKYENYLNNVIKIKLNNWCRLNKDSSKILSSGNLKLILNIKLKNSVVEFNSVEYVFKVVNHFFNNFTFNLAPDVNAKLALTSNPDYIYRIIDPNLKVIQSSRRYSFFTKYNNFSKIGDSSKIEAEIVNYNLKLKLSDILLLLK